MSELLKSCYLHAGIYDAHIVHQTLGISELTFAGIASTQFTNREA